MDDLKAGEATCPQGHPLASRPSISDGACSRCLLEMGLGDGSLDVEEFPSIDALEAIGDRIGPYEILDVVGEGGMGVVYRAMQSAPMRRQVALKLIKPGMDTREILARFETERQALARMNHPNISQVHDAGVTTSGRPYFVMELVTGQSITAYCDGRRLGLEERLAVFLQACAALHHAHQKGIIHRDVKPSNVLVGEEEGRPHAKVIDFGIAKATEGRAGSGRTGTRAGSLVGTPGRMSPEQLAPEGLDVDTRADVYGLGLLLYELLAGALPWEGLGSTGEDSESYRRRLLEEEPVTPSARVASLGADAAEAAARREADPRGLRRRLEGDLDWIVMKAIERDRSRRYESVRDLAADVERHLRHEPVTAGPPGVAYLLGKFVRRHRLGVATTAASVVLLVAVTVTMGLQARRISVQRDRANREAETARQISKLLVDLFEVSDPGESRGSSISAREILDAGALRVERDLSDRPELQARMMATIGTVYRKLGLYERSADLLGRSLETRRRILGARHRETVNTMVELGGIALYRGKPEEAEGLMREALAAAREVLGETDPVTLAALSDLGVILQFQGRLSEAETIYREALDRRKAVLGADAAETLETENNLATLLYAQGRLADAEPYLRGALEGRRRALGPDHPETLDSMINLCPVLMALDRVAEAEPICREALEAGRRVRPDHPKTIVSINNLGKALGLLGRDAEAEPLYKEAIAALRRTVGDDHPDTITAIGNLGDLYTTRRRLPEAEALLVPALGAVRRVLPPGHVVTGLTLINYGRFMTATARYDEAEKMMLDGHAILLRTVGPEHRYTRRGADSLRALYETWGKPEKASQWSAAR